MATKARRAAGELDTNMLKCRAIAHAWEPTLVTAVTAQRRRAREVVLQCQHCLSRRVDTVDLQGRLVYRDYERVEGYSVSYAEYGGRKEFNEAARAELYGRLEGKRLGLKVVS